MSYPARRTLFYTSVMASDVPEMLISLGKLDTNDFHVMLPHVLEIQQKITSKMLGVADDMSKDILQHNPEWDQEDAIVQMTRDSSLASLWVCGSLIRQYFQITDLDEDAARQVMAKKVSENDPFAMGVYRAWGAMNYLYQVMKSLKEDAQ